MYKSDFEALKGKVVRFTEVIESFEVGFDPGMRAVVKSVSFDDHSDGSASARLELDFSMFEETNKEFGKNTYYDSEGTPRLYWWETQFYPKDKVEELWLAVGNYPVGFEVVPELSDKVIRYLGVYEAAQRLREVYEPKSLLEGVLNPFTNDSLEHKCWTAGIAGQNLPSEVYDLVQEE